MRLSNTPLCVKLVNTMGLRKVRAFLHDRISYAFKSHSIWPRSSGKNSLLWLAALVCLEAGQTNETDNERAEGERDGGVREPCHYDALRKLPAESTTLSLGQVRNFQRIRAPHVSPFGRLSGRFWRLFALQINITYHKNGGH